MAAASQHTVIWLPENSVTLRFEGEGTFTASQRPCQGKEQRGSAAVAEGAYMW